MIKNIIFDIGDVLVGYSLSNFTLKNKKISLKKLEQANQILIKSEIWREYLNGNVLIQEIQETLNLNYPEYIEEFKIILEKKYQKDILVFIKENIAILKQLKENGYHIYLLSNITKETLEAIKENDDFIQWTDGGVFSYQEHKSKPVKEVYSTLLSRYCLIPKESIYIDDRKKNVEVAENLGMIGIHYQSSINLAEEIQKKIGGAKWIFKK